MDVPPDVPVGVNIANFADFVFCKPLKSVGVGPDGGPFTPATPVQIRLGMPVIVNDFRPLCDEH
jgi:hypothetical protein